MACTICIFVILIAAFIGFLAAEGGFTQKTECLLDFVHDEFEGDGEDHERRGGNARYGNGAWPDHSLKAWPEAAPPTGWHGGGMDAEDLRERMGLDEVEEEGRGRAYGDGRGRGMYGGWYGGGEEKDEREIGGDKRKRRRRRRQARVDSYFYGPARSRHSPTSLYGTLTCGQTSMIHVLNVTVGYSDSSYCFQAYDGCQAGSAKARQVIHCQGQAGSCDFTIRRHFIGRCGQMINFASIAYECIAASSRINICSSANSDISGSVALTSPSYPLATGQKLAADAELLTCECTLRASSGSTFEVEYLRTHMSQLDGTCDGDMVLLERPDPASRSLAQARYSLERELCGHNVSTHLAVRDSILRVTFLGGAPLAEDRAGFVAKFKAWNSSGGKELFHASCTGEDPAYVAVSTTRPSHTDRLSQWMTSRDRRLPGESRLTGSANSQGYIGSFGSPGGEEVNGPGERSPVGGADVAREEEGKSGSDPGVLSGVVASLASVILILVSIGALIFYRRHKKKLRKRVEEEGDYGVYQSGTYYEGSPSSIEENTAPPSKSKRNGSKKNWRESRFAEYGWMLVRVLGKQKTNSPRSNSKAVEANTVDQSTASASSGVYCVTSPAAQPENVRCFADVHHKLRPPTREAPRPPPYPPPVLKKLETPPAAKPCPSPVAPPRRQKTLRLDNTKQSLRSMPTTEPSPYDNVLQGSTISSSSLSTPTRVDNNPTKSGCSGTVFVKLKADDKEKSSNNKNDTGEDAIVKERNNTFTTQTESLKDTHVIKECSSRPRIEGQADITLNTTQGKIDDEETGGGIDSDSGSNGPGVDDSEDDETYTSINALNNALYNLGNSSSH